ncbi:MAG TPA: DUF4431 domain-containing protein [Allosphingosinicella sp.]|jgi:hypothetical protein
MFNKVRVWAITLVLVAPAAARQPVNPGSCLDLAGADSWVTVSGVLTSRSFAGPPNYESIAKGDREERALILKLPVPSCATDREFIEAGTTFDQVHLSASEAAILNALNLAVGRSVTVRGRAFGAHTGHHRAPLVLIVEEVRVQ